MSRKICVGDRVKHYGTKMIGTVLEVRPMPDGSCELKVQRDKPLSPGGSNEPTWWATYHVGWSVPAGERFLEEGQ